MIFRCVLALLQLLALHLLHQLSLGPASRWHLYLQNLPPSYTTAISLLPEERDALQVQYAVHQADAAAEEAAQQWRGIAAAVLTSLSLPPKLRSKSAWLWALSTISSRTMYMPGDDAGALTPFGDLHNYGLPPPPFTPSILSCGGSGAGRPSEAQDDDSGGADWGDGALDETSGQYRVYARRRYGVRLRSG